MDGSDRYTSQVSVDAEPWSSQADQRSSRDDPRGAIPRTGSARQPTLTPNTEQLYTGRGNPDDDLNKSSPAKLSRADFIKEHFDKLPKNLKVGYYDVMVLYNRDEDYSEAERFREHLEREIFTDGSKEIKAVLYDGPELEGLSASQLQHLDEAFSRCTFTFVYLTKQFVECSWCSLSSESCLMQAIYDVEKKWCVVPVYTVQRNKADFRIPMGLNSLKGINYYHADEFYRKGVKRLVGDKIFKRIEHERKLEENRYNYLVRKVQEENEREQRLHLQHEYTQNILRMQQMEMQRDRELLRSQSESVIAEQYQVQSQRNILCATGSAYPKTAGNMGYPPSFPDRYMSKHASESDDMSSVASQYGKQKIPDEMNLKPDIQMHPSSSEPSSFKSGQYNTSDLGPSSRYSEPSMDFEDLSKDYVSAPPNAKTHNVPQQSGQNEVHIHYHIGENRKEEPKTVPNTFNINAENVIIGENGKIVFTDGKPVKLENFMEKGSEKESSSLQRDGSQRGSIQDTETTYYRDNGYSTGQSAGNSTGLGGNSSPVEHSEPRRISQVPPHNPNIKMETVTPLTSANCEHTSVKGMEDNTYSKNTAGPENLVLNRQPSGKLSSDINKKNNEDEDLKCNIPPKQFNSNCSKVAKFGPTNSKTGSSRPIRPFQPNPASSPLIALVPPVKPDKKQNVSSVSDDTEVKQTGSSHQTLPKVPSLSDNEETFLKSPSNLSSSANESCDPDDTELLKPVRSRKDKSENSKLSVSSLETDGCNGLSSSTEESSPILSKDDSDMDAVKLSLQMGYTREQVRDALTILRRIRPGHQHFSINDLLDALNGKTTVNTAKKQRSVEEKDDWVTLSKEEVTVESSVDRNNVSQPVTIQKSTASSLTGSQKSLSKKKDNCKMS